MKVYLSKQAEYKLNKLVVFLIEEWGIKVKNNFISKLKTKLNQISSYPNSCKKSIRINNMYKCVLTKHTTFYYRIINNEIEIITFFDNRQNPKTILKEL